MHARPAGPGVRDVEVGGRLHALGALGDAVHGELRWIQPRVFGREWQLVTDRGEHLLVRGRGWTRRHAVVETPEATWSLARSWLGDIALADPEGRPLMRMTRTWWGGRSLEPAAGPALRWRWHWRGLRTLESEEGHELLRLRPRWSLLRREATIVLADAARRRDDLLALLAVTFYAWLSRRRDRPH